MTRRACRREELALNDLSEIEVRGIRTHPSGAKNRASPNTYRCQVPANGGERSILLAETRDAREDASTPRRAALPLGVEPARALGVPHRYVDYR